MDYVQQLPATSSKASTGTHAMASLIRFAKRGRHHSRWQRGEQLRSLFDCQYNETTNRMTTLDQRLYAWLHEADEQRFQRGFSDYFSVAYPAVMRRLARLSNWDPSDLEEIAQDALLRFFERAGHGRREAAAALAGALAHIRPPDLGPFNARQVQAWTGAVAEFRATTVTFRPPPADAGIDPSWKQVIHDLAAEIPQLQRRGWQLIDVVRIALNWPADSDSGPAESLAAAIEARTPQAVAAESTLPGTLSFVDDTSTVISLLPRLRVPSNSYLFEIATTIYFDACRSRGRQKRGGRLPGPAHATVDPAGDVSAHPLEQLLLEPEDGREDAVEVGETWGRQPDRVAPSGGDLSGVDEAQRYEDEQFMQRFYDHLRNPVDRAMAAYEAARTKGSGAAERLRLDSLTQKFSRSVAVMRALGEGYTQEQTAQRLGISRNQVKYVVELIQEALRRFSAISPDHVDVARQSTPGVASHVR
jgi:DNA-directed RNA polymerase specialized sigma24 family protein